MMYSLDSKSDKSFELRLNCARNCLRYIVNAYEIKEIYIPFYTCQVVWQSLQKENCKIKFYHIDKALYPAEKFPKNAFILYTNYSGICSQNIKRLTNEYQNMIIDNAQAFFMPKYGIASFNSVRKFISAPDGAFLSINKIIEIPLEKETASINYDKNSFNSNKILFDSKNIKIMSDITSEILNNTDLNEIKKVRLSNFNMLHNTLCKTNKLKINISDEDIPMFYPYLTYNAEIERKLLQENIEVEKFWNLQPENTVEGNLQRHLLYLPIDQNHSGEDMLKINNIIQKHK